MNLPPVGTVVHYLNASTDTGQCAYASAFPEAKCQAAIVFHHEHDRVHVNVIDDYGWIVHTNIEVGDTLTPGTIHPIH